VTASAATCFPVAGSNLDDEARQHLLHALRRFQRLNYRRRGRQGGTLAKLELELQLACRAQRDAQTTTQIAACRTTAPLGDVGAHGNRSSSSLPSEVESLTRWKYCRDGIYFQRQLASAWYA
jgi:hypothetical protein